MIKFVVLALAVGIVSCQYHGGYEREEYAEPHYSYEYHVNDPHTYDIHGQKEERKGDQTHGEYYLVEPDGSRRTIQYHVEGKSGFLADVHKEGGKGYDKPSYYKPEPSYHKPEPSYHKPSYYH